MKLTKRTEYALQFLIYLARQEEETLVSAKEVAAQQKLSLKVLQNVIGDLVKHDIVKSFSGAKGGNRLDRLPSCISVLSVIEAVEGPITILDCMEDSDNCNEFSICKIHSVLGKALFAMNEVLADTFISDLT
ncbi:MAG: Rrf2 family transcriptional regulator [Fibrobacterales bacterium]